MGAAGTGRVVVLQSIRSVGATTNPYLAQLLNGFSAVEGVESVGFTWRRALLGRWDVLHVHWPEVIFRRQGHSRTIAGMVLLALLLVRIRLTRRALVRTIHNTAPHERGLPGERWLLALLDRWTTERIALSDAVRLPDDVPTVVIPHGHYRDWYAEYPTSKEVRGRLLTIGLLRPYKGVECVLEVVRSSDAPLELHVVGRPATTKMAENLRRLAGDDPRIHLTLRHVDDSELVREICEAELVVLPYRTMQNSGVVLLALSLGRPVLVPDNPLNRALVSEVGPGWVRLFGARLTQPVLERAVVESRARAPGKPPDLSAREWPAATAAHLAVYREATAMARSGGRRSRSPGRSGLRIAMVGTRGVPARYGGFETCVEEVGRRLSERGHDVVVYCRRSDAKTDRHLGMRLVHLPAFRHRVLETLSHTGLSVAHLLLHRVDAVFLFNAANALWLPLLRVARLPVATHVDGLEWQRAKWGPAGRRYYKLAEGWAVRGSNALIADSRGIRDHYAKRFGASSELISYGAPVVDGRTDRLAELDLQAGRYHLVVARFEPENHVDMVVEGYVSSGARLPLVVVGSAPYADEYISRVHSLADERVRFLGAVWDQELLDQLYSGALTYLHGHSVGGTNPSLLRAIGAGAATTAFDVIFNREVLGDLGRYFTAPAAVALLVDDAEADPAACLDRGAALLIRARAYDWQVVAEAYEMLARRLSDRTVGPPRQGGRRAVSVAGSGPAAETEREESG